MTLFKAAAATALTILLTMPAAAAEWTVDHAESSLGFALKAQGNAVEGRFRTFEAAIRFDPADLENAAVSVSVDIASAQTGTDQIDGALSGEAIFNIPDFPEATFTSRAFRSTGGSSYEMDGDLTLKGVTRPVTIPFRLEVSGNRAQAASEFDLMRTAFGVGTGQLESDAAASHPVKISISISAVKKN